MTSESLATLQQQFMDHLRGVPGNALAPMIAHGRMPPATGVGIYTHAYGARLREALAHDHPVLGTYLGDTLWDALCQGYVAAHPSRHRSLRDFGADLPQYLADTAPFNAHPEIAEFACFERRLLHSFDAADASSTDWNAVLRIPQLDWPALQMRFHPSLLVHDTQSNSVEIWQAIKQAAPPPPCLPGAMHWALWRDADRISRFRSLTAEERQALAHCMQGGNFADLCVQLLAWHPADGVPMAALDHLRTWSSAGWITRWN